MRKGDVTVCGLEPERSNGVEGVTFFCRAVRTGGSVTEDDKTVAVNLKMRKIFGEKYELVCRKILILKLILCFRLVFNLTKKVFDIYCSLVQFCEYFYFAF